MIMKHIIKEGWGQTEPRTVIALIQMQKQFDDDRESNNKEALLQIDLEPARHYYPCDPINKRTTYHYTYAEIRCLGQSGHTKVLVSDEEEKI